MEAKAMQVKLAATVKCTDGEAGRVSRIIVDPILKTISHLVVLSDGHERVIPLDSRVSINSETVQLKFPISELSGFPLLRREDFVELKEVEIAGLERHLEVTPGETLVPIPPIEKDPSRRAFFIKLSNAIGVVLALPLVYPILRYLTQPLYRPFDNSWIKITNANRVSETNTPQQVKFQKEVKEGYLTRELNKSHWVIKATPDLLKEVYGGKDKEYRDQNGNVFWVNRKEIDIVVYAGKCPHLGCAYRWKQNKHRFFCPCHLSIYELSGRVVSGPAPRPLDVLPTRVSPSGEIEIIDAEFKAGKTHMVRIV